MRIAREFLSVAGALAGGALLIVLLFQVPVHHMVDIGGYDAAYVQGFHDPQYQDYAPEAALTGSDGQARWSKAQSFLLFPQAGLPAEISLRIRGWRPSGTPYPTVTFLLNGREPLATIETDGSWQSVRLPVPLADGLWKPDDVVLEIRSATTTFPGDARQVGVLLDKVEYIVPAAHAGASIIIPYPTQVLAGGLATALCWLWITHATRIRRRKTALALFLLLLGMLFLFCYRQPPPLYPAPLRWLLPGVNLLLFALLVLHYAPALLARYRWLPSVAAVGGSLLWLVAVLWTAQNHVTLSVPGVEKDFRVFATRATDLERVFQTDGFYNLGYPLLLWLVHPLTAGNVFLAGRLIAALSGTLLLLASCWLTHLVIGTKQEQGRGLWGLLVVLLLAFSPLVVQYALYVGSDMPFAALLVLALALFLHAAQQKPDARSRHVWLFLAGIAGGGAFLMRHQGLVLLPWGILACFFMPGMHHPHTPPARTIFPPPRLLAYSASLVPFVLGFLLAAMPQLLVNTIQTGQPLYSQQAKNIWLAVYGNIDWGRWNEVPNTIPLSEVVLRDPARFVRNWWHNIIAFLGTGAEETGEFGRAIQLRLLAWPANWLAVCGVVGWLAHILTHLGKNQPAAQQTTTFLAKSDETDRLSYRPLLLLFIGLYVAITSLAFVLPRFFLPLAPLYAVAAASTVRWLATRVTPPQDTLRFIRYVVLITLLLLLLLHAGFRIGSHSVLQQQPSDEVAILKLTDQKLQPGEKVLVHVPPTVPLHKYSALAHRAIALPDVADAQTTLTQAQSQHPAIAYLLWDEKMGDIPLPASDDRQVGRAGRYGLYRLMRE